jgi:hypothetical protein
MKTRYRLLAIIALLALFFTPELLRAQDDSNDDQGASFQTFYDQLSDQGTWIQTDDYGYVFQPAVTDPTWTPYSRGHWVYTNVGWLWASNEPWGWATYHYGRWINIDGTGWVWVPGYRWAPAWVSWRYGGGYAGWAPLPPETFAGVEFGDSGGYGGGGFHFGGDVDVSFHIGPGEYNFVHVSDMGETNYRPFYVDHYNNYEIINRTANITNINVSSDNAGATADFSGVAAGGPPIAEINAHAREHVPTVNLTAASQPGVNSLNGNTLAVYAPRVNPASIHQARPAVIGQTINHPTFNRGDSITKLLAVTATVKPRPPGGLAIAAARQAQAHIPPSAKVVTAATPIRSALTKPLTSMEPVSHASPGTSETSPNVEHQATTSATSSEFDKPHVAQPEEPKPENVYHPQTAPAPTQPQHEEEPPAEHQPQFQVQHEQPVEHQPQAQVVHQAPAPAPAQHQPQAQPQGKPAAPGPGAPNDKKKLPGQ